MATSSGSVSIAAVIVQVIDPISYEAKVHIDPGKNDKYQSIKQLEDSLNDYYNIFEAVPGEEFIPRIGQTIVVRHPLTRRWFRAKCKASYDRPNGININTYLLDYGQEVTVASHGVRKIKEEFVNFPCQCIRFSLPGLVPSTLSFGSDLQLRHSISNKWDPSVIVHVKRLIRESSSTRLEILSCSEDEVYQVLLYLAKDDSEICVNDDLVSKRYAKLQQSKFRDAVSPLPDEIDSEVSLDELHANLDRKLEELDHGDDVSDFDLIDQPASCLVYPSELAASSMRNTSTRLTPSHGDHSVLSRGSGTSSLSSQGSTVGSGYKKDPLHPLRLPNTSSILLSSAGSSIGAMPSTVAPQKVITIPELLTVSNSQPPLVSRSLANVRPILVTPSFRAEESLPAMVTSPRDADGLPELLTAISSRPPSVGHGLANIRPILTTPYFRADESLPAVVTSPRDTDGLPELLTAISSRPPSVGRGMAFAKLLKLPPAGRVKASSPPRRHAVGRGRSASVASESSLVSTVGNGGLASPSPSLISAAGIGRAAPPNGSSNSNAVGKGSTTSLVGEPPSARPACGAGRASAPSGTAGIGRGQKIMAALMQSRASAVGGLASPSARATPKPVSPKIAIPIAFDKSTPTTADSSIPMIADKVTLTPAFIKSLNVDATTQQPTTDASTTVTKTANSGEKMTSDKVLHLANGNPLITENKKAELPWRKRSTDSPPADRPGATIQNNAQESTSWRRRSSDSGTSDERRGNIAEAGDDRNQRSENSREVGRCDRTMTVSHRYHDEPEQNFLISTTMDDPLGIEGGASSSVKLLSSGKKLPKQPITNIKLAAFDTFICERLEALKIRSPSWIQSNIWPAINRGRNIAVISEARSGKTYSYLVPLLSLIIKNETCAKVPPGNEPISIIVCPSWVTVDHVHRECLRILDRSHVRVSKVHGGDTGAAYEIELMRGCEILVVTPSALARLLTSKGIKATGFSRLCYLIFEDIDVLLERFTKEIAVIRTAFEKTMTQRRNQERVDIPQTVMAFGRKWNDGLCSFIKQMMPDPLFFCSSFFEAIVCCGVELVPLTVKLEQRLDTLLEVVKDRLEINRHKFVIFVSDPASGTEVYRALQKRCSYVFFAHHNMQPNEIVAVQLCWNETHPPEEQPVLVLTDGVLDEMNIVDASWLIHFDIPTIKKSMFGRRFSCMMNRMTEAVANITAPKPANCSSTLIITQESDLQARTLHLLLKRLKIKVPQPLSHFMYGYYQDREEKKVSVPLCYYWKALGSCPKDYWCPERHLLLQSDTPQPDLARGGYVRVVITAVRNASTYHGRVTGYRGVEPAWVDRDERNRLLTTTLQNHFSDRDHCVPQGNPRDGDLCVVQGDDNVYRRVQVLPQGEGTAIARDLRKVLFVDEGHKDAVKMVDLLKMPENVRDISPLSFEIILCYVTPVDKDLDWTFNANDFVKNLILGKELIGKVILSLGNTLWLAPLVKQAYQEESKTTYYEFYVKQTLLDQKLAMDNPDHMKLIEPTCVRFFNLPPPIEVGSGAQVGEAEDDPDKPPECDPDFAYLSMEEMNFVWMSSVYSPSRFYLRQASPIHADALEDLMDDLEEYIENEQPKPLTHVRVGAYCIAKFPADEGHYRSKIVAVVPSVNDPTVEDVEVFYVDYGDTRTVARTDVYPLTSKFVWRLPFQAIECSLVGVAPLPGQDWTMEGVELMRDFTTCDDGEKALEVEAVKKRAIETKERRSRYEVEILDNRGYNLADQLCLWGHCMETMPTESEPELPNDIQEASPARSAEAEDQLDDVSHYVGVVTLPDINDSSFHLQSDVVDVVVDLKAAYDVVDVCNLGVLMLPDIDMDDPPPLLHGDPVDMVAEICDPVPIISEPVTVISELVTVISDPVDLVIDLVNGDADQVATCNEPSLIQVDPLAVDSTLKKLVVGVSVIEPSTSRQEKELADKKRVKKKHSHTKRKRSTSVNRPSVKWSQTSDVITLKLFVQGVKTDLVYTEGSRLTYITIVAGKRYELDDQLYAEVVADKTKYVISQSYVTIKMTKSVQEEWPRLLKTRTKYHWLSVDFDKVGLSCPNSDDEIDWETHQNASHRYCHPAGIESSSSSSSDSSTSDADESFEEMLTDEYEPFGK